MGQDYVARKAAKKQRKRQTRDAETGRKSGKRKRSKQQADGLEVVDIDDGLGGSGLSQEQRKRKRKKGNNVSLRISRSLCYKAPQLTEEDKTWDGGWEEEGQPAGLPNMAAFTQSGYDSDVEEQLQKLPPQQQQQQQQQQAKPGKQQQQQQQQQQQSKPRLSTGVGLLDPKQAAKQAAQRATQQQQRKQQQQQLDDVIASCPALKTLAETLNPCLALCMAKLGFTEPTPIQAAAWPPAMAGRDVQGVAEPGSGKTLAYLLPGLINLAAAAAAANGSTAVQPSSSSSSTAVQPHMLILTPSRELAQQVHSQCLAATAAAAAAAAAAAGAAAAAAAAASCCIVYGGVSKQQQVQQLQQQQPVVLVATPGRLLDLIGDGVIGLAAVRYAVLDEADKMLSVGFEPQLQILKGLLLGGGSSSSSGSRDGKPAAAAAVAGEAGAAAGGKKQKRLKHAAGGESQQQQQQQQRPQVLLFTATLPAAVQSTAAAWLLPDAVKVSCTAGADSISRTITQVVHVCAEHKKPAKLLKHLAAVKAAAAGLRNPPRVLVFANKIKTVLFLQRTLLDAGFRVAMLHGKRSQAERDAAVADFKAGKAQVLVASDVASRGLDIRGLPYVVNYDFPSNLETYIHRVGRTGRLAAAGHAFSFFTRPMAKLAGPIVSLLEAHGQAVDPNLLALADAWRQAEAALAAQGRALPQPAGSDGEEEEAPAGEAGAAATATAAAVPEDLLEGLPQQPKWQSNPAAAAVAAPSKQQQQQQLEQPSRKRKKVKQAGDMLMVPQPAAAAAASPGGSGGSNSSSSVQEFLPCPQFAGAKPGMVFKKGPRGLGYYRDAVAAATATKHTQTPQQQQGQQQQHREKLRDMPIKKKGLSLQPELPPLPGLAKKRPASFSAADLSYDDGAGVLDAAAAAVGAGSNKKKRKDRSSGHHSDDSGSGDEGGAVRGGSFGSRLQLQGSNQVKGQKKALPGRLRRKLAKQNAAVAAVGGKKTKGP